VGGDLAPLVHQDALEQRRAERLRDAALDLAAALQGDNGSNVISCPHCPARGKVFAKPGTVIGIDRLNSQLDIADQSQAGYLQNDKGHLLIFVVLVNSATAPNIRILRIFDDSNQISALLQEEASATVSHRGHHLSQAHQLA
jgi:D-alanyl-D-alanine carboxypeptidase/D-alanyl-D-alanine-endopeptidase (penicillin-binding protein 4)